MNFSVSVHVLRCAVMHTNYSHIPIVSTVVVNRVVSVWNSLQPTVQFTTFAPFKQTFTHVKLMESLRMFNAYISMFVCSVGC